MTIAHLRNFNSHARNGTCDDAEKNNCPEIYTIHVEGVRKCIETYVNICNAVKDISDLQEK